MTYPPTQTFWLEPTDEIAVGLRRYHSADGSGFTCATGYHSALTYIGQRPAEYAESDGHQHLVAPVDDIDHDDDRWPHTCAQLCGYEFTDADRFQPWTELLYLRVDTDELRVLHTGAPAPFAPSAEPGAMWDAWWMPFARGDDGICLMVRLANNHDWNVDSQASNCTRPGEPHHCWVRHGDPRTEPVTVDKNGDTCAAGAGSILAGDYHGFLQAGVLTAG